MLVQYYSAYLYTCVFLSTSCKAFVVLIFCFVLISFKSNQVFHYTRCITLKPVRSLGAHRRVIAPGNATPFEMLLRWRAAGKTMSDSTGPKFEPQTSHFRDERYSKFYIFVL